MAEDDLKIADALGLGGTNVTLPQHIEHRGSGQTGNVGHWIERERDDRQNQPLGRCSIGREYVPFDGKYHQQQRAHNKGRHRDKGGRDDHDDLVDQTVAPQRRDRAQHHADDQGQKSGNNSEPGRGLQPVANNIDDHTPALLKRGAEIKLRQNIAEIGDILLEEGLVESVFGLERRLSGLGNGLLAHERAAGNGMHDKKGDRDDDPDRQQRQADPF